MQTEAFKAAVYHHVNERKGGKIYADIKQWAREELNIGNRIKASRIDRVAERLVNG